MQITEITQWNKTRQVSNNLKLKKGLKYNEPWRNRKDSSMRISLIRKENKFKDKHKDKCKWFSHYDIRLR